MSHTRRKDQSVDAFSLPTSLLEKVKERAASLKMTRSGFYRFCLAKELGFSEEDARVFAEHRAVLNSVDAALAERVPDAGFPAAKGVFYGGSPMVPVAGLNDVPNSTVAAAGARALKKAGAASRRAAPK